MPPNELLYQIALSLVPGIGSITARQLIAYLGSCEAIFKEKKQNLLKIPDIGEILAARIVNANTLAQAEKELAFIEKYQIRALYYLSDEYSGRLRQCPDAPIVLYVKGGSNLNASKMISIVGTRSATAYGRELCQSFVEDLASLGHRFTVISGLAYGIDVSAHRASLKAGQPTIAVLGHGLKSIYPSLHVEIAKEIARQGALVTDFTSDITVERNNFLRRNRIIAGMSDATIVVESAVKGGALITAEMADSYGRDVFAFPGRVGDEFSTGCHRLVMRNKAALITSAKDLEYMLGWEVNDRQQPQQGELFVELTGTEKQIWEALRKHGPLLIDELSVKLNIPVGQLSANLLNMELSGRVISLPGKVYQLN